MKSQYLRDMGGYYWVEQQKAQARKAQATKPPLQVVQPQVKDKFAQVEAEAAKLRQAMAAGLLTKKQFKRRLKKLEVRDALGTRWRIKAKTGLWHRYNGTKWVPGIPHFRF